METFNVHHRRAELLPMTSVLPTVVRVAVTLLAIAGTAGHVAYLDTLWWHSLGLTDTVARDVSPSLITLLTAHALVSLVSALLAVALVLHEGEREDAARGLGVAFGAWAYLMAYSGVTLLFRPNPGLMRQLFEGHFLLIEVVGLAGLLRFTARFPTQLDPERIEPSPTMPSVLLPAHAVSVAMLRPAAPLLAGVGVLGLAWGVTVAAGGEIADAGLSPLMDLVRLVAAGLVVTNVRRSWGHADEDGRPRLQWLLVALSLLLGSLALMIGGNVLVTVTGLTEPTLAWRPLLLDLGLIGFLGGIALSVLYAGPIRPADVVLKVVSTASVVTLGLFLAAGLEALLSGRLVAAFSLRTGFGTALALATMISTYRGLVRLVERALPQS